MAKKTLSINLAKNKESLGDKIITWSFTTGRILIILVEVVALVAFLYRFILDIQVGNLKTDIKQKQTILYNFKDKENTYRNLQDRLALAASFSKQNNKLFNTFTDILDLLPSGLTINNISLNQNAVAMTINVNSVSALSGFTNSLKSYPDVQSISIDKIENRTTASTITVSLTINLKKG
jgi:Tfp pilus assembly protein PilO